jgi:hypothetical protein
LWKYRLAGSFSGMATDPVATAASNNPVLSTLVTAVKKASLVDTLNSAQNITVFAPTNDAFAKIPKADLDKLLADKKKLTSGPTTTSRIHTPPCLGWPEQHRRSLASAHPATSNLLHKQLTNQLPRAIFPNTPDKVTIVKKRPSRLSGAPHHP